MTNHLKILSLLIIVLSLVSSETALYDSNSPLEQKILAMRDGEHNPYKEFNEWVNSYFFGAFGISFIEARVNSVFGLEAGYYVLCYLRDLFGGTVVYWLTAGLWHLTIYNIFGRELFDKKSRPYPSRETILDQMALAQSSIFVYAGLPIVSEYFIENRLTRCFFYLGEVGLLPAVLYFILYIVLVEIGIYWM